MALQETEIGCFCAKIGQFLNHTFQFASVSGIIVSSLLIIRELWTRGLTMEAPDPEAWSTNWTPVKSPFYTRLEYGRPTSFNNHQARVSLGWLESLDNRQNLHIIKFLHKI